VERTKKDAEAAKKKVEEKQVILDKLSRVRSVIKFIKPIGDAVSDVSALPLA
jgi:hypothetical protein